LQKPSIKYLLPVEEFLMEEKIIEKETKQDDLPEE
jgi:hypothetical protein